MKATIENGVLWIGSETYEEVLITDAWAKDNAEGIKLLIQNYKMTGRKTPTIKFVGIVLEDKSKTPQGFEKLVNNPALKRKTPKGKQEILQLYYDWLAIPTSEDMSFDVFILECED